MGKQLIAIIAVGSLLGSEAVSEIDTRGLHWMAAPDHNHTEIPESVARGLAHLLSLTTANPYKVAHFCRVIVFIAKGWEPGATPVSMGHLRSAQKPLP
jgi:hypothetical protein